MNRFELGSRYRTDMHNLLTVKEEVQRLLSTGIIVNAPFYTHTHTPPRVCYLNATDVYAASLSL